MARRNVTLAGILLSVLTAMPAWALEFQPLDLPAAAAHLEQGKPLLLYVALSDCGFCKRLEADVMPVLLQQQPYTERIQVQKMLWDSNLPVVWHGGTQLSPDEIARKFRIRATPTLLFLDAEGNEIAKRIEGYRDASFYWSYLDASIAAAEQALAP